MAAAKPDFRSIIADIKKKQFKPIYLLHGEEPYFIDKINNALEKNCLTEAEKGFNFVNLYGKDTSEIDIISTAKRFPMMAPYNVVIVKEAQALRKIELLEAYALQPNMQSILVLCLKNKKLDKRKKLFKAIQKHGVCFDRDKIKDYKIGEWINNFLHTKKYGVEDQALYLMSEYLGTNLTHIENELNKLMMHLQAGEKINVKHVEKHIGINREYNVFELQKAIAARNIHKVYRIVHYFESNPKAGPMPFVLGNLYNYFNKIYMLHFVKNRGDGDVQKMLGLKFPFLVKEYRRAAQFFDLRKTQTALKLLLVYDLKSKGVNSHNFKQSELLKELVYRLMH